MNLSREFDLMLLLAAALAILFGITMIYSASSPSVVWKSQATYGVVFLVLAVAIVYIPDKVLYGVAYPLYGVSILSLLAVLAWGTGESSRWLSLGSISVQPSEFAKVATVMALARYLGDCSSEEVARPRPVVAVLSLCALPMFLVAEQPDLGTAMSLGAALLPMLYWAGMRPLYVFFITAPLLSVAFSFEPLWGQDWAPIVFAIFIIASSVAIQVMLSRLWVTLTLLAVNLSAGLINVVIWQNFLHSYQRGRIETLLDPESDPLGKGWNIIQSKIAIGSGGLMGKGFLQGTQTKYEFLPEAHTDFIFSVVGEELGFLGTVVVLATFLFLIWRAVYVGTMANNRFFSLLAIGLASSTAFHVFVNVGMTIGVMPVTGLPLPFLSYGGSSLLTNCVIIGLLLHVYAHRHDY